MTTPTRIEHPAVAALRGVIAALDGRLHSAQAMAALANARSALAASAAHDEAFADMLAALKLAQAIVRASIEPGFPSPIVASRIKTRVLPKIETAIATAEGRP